MADLPDTCQIWEIVERIEEILKDHDFDLNTPIREAVECAAELSDYLNNDVLLEDLM